MYKTGEWSKDCIEVTMIALKKKPKATKCSSHLTVSLVAHRAKIAVRLPRRRMERKIKNMLEEDQLGCRGGKGPRDAVRILRILSERTLDKDEELCTCFIDWQKVFEHVNWTKLMQILKVTGTNWCKRRLINQLYVDQSVKLKLDQAETRRVKTGRGVRQGCCCQFCSTCTVNTLTRKLKKALETSYEVRANMNYNLFVVQKCSMVH